MSSSCLQDGGTRSGDASGNGVKEGERRCDGCACVCTIGMVVGAVAVGEGERNRGDGSDEEEKRACACQHQKRGKVRSVHEQCMPPVLRTVEPCYNNKQTRWITNNAPYLNL